MRDEAVARAMGELGWEGNVCCADTFLRRLLGMIGLSPCDGADSPRILVFSRCSSVHTFCMGYPLDIAFADEQGVVLARHDRVGPCRVLAYPGAYMVLERASAV